MAIKTKEVAITEGSDAGKTFIVSQMSLIAGDSWANRAALAVMRSGVDVSSLKGMTVQDGKFVGMLDIASVISVILKALGGVDERTAQSLLDELLGVIKVKLPDGTTRAIVLPKEDAAGRIGDITCIKTLWKLRVEAIKVNLDFLMAGVTQ